MSYAGLLFRQMAVASSCLSGAALLGLPLPKPTVQRPPSGAAQHVYQHRIRRSRPRLSHRAARREVVRFFALVVDRPSARSNSAADRQATAMSARFRDAVSQRIDSIQRVSATVRVCRVTRLLPLRHWSIVSDDEQAGALHIAQPSA